MSIHLHPRLALGTAAFATLLTLGACANGADQDSKGDAPAASVAEDVPAEELDGVTEPSPANASVLKTSVDGAADQAGGKAEAPTVAIISTGNVALEAEDVAQARFDVQQIVDEFRGTVSGEETTTGDDGKAETTRMVLRIPSSSFGKVMKELEKVAELESSSAGSEDVTTKVIDNEVRIRAQERALERMEALLAEAESLREVISIESQLTRRQAELDSLKSTQKWLADQTTLSTITVSVQRTPEEPKENDEESGFLGGLDRGWGGLVAVAAGLVTLLGLVLPFAVVLALLGVPLWLAVRNARRRRPATVATDA